MTSQTMTFAKDMPPYISKGSTIDVPKPWKQGGMVCSAIVHPIGTEMKLFLNQPMVEYLIKDGAVTLPE